MLSLESGTDGLIDTTVRRSHNQDRSLIVETVLASVAVPVSTNPEMRFRFEEIYHVCNKGSSYSDRRNFLGLQASEPR